MFISTLSDDINEIIGQNKWNPFSLHTKFALKISKKVSEINMKKLQRNLLLTQHIEINRNLLTFPDLVNMILSE